MERFKPHYPPRRRSPARLPVTSSRRLGWVFLVASVGVLVLPAWNIGTSRLIAQETAATAARRENQIKAAYLYQLGRYIQWPAKAFPNAQTPFVIGVLKQDPIGVDLDQIAQIKKIEERPILIRRFSSEGDVPACHILFLPASLAPEVQATVVRKVSGKNVLLVGEAAKFLDLGGAVRFVIEENNVRLHIARKAAQREGLTISSKLLQVARVLD